MEAVKKSQELTIGRAGEYLVLADVLLHGYQAFETGQGVSYDMIIQHEEHLIRTQVKTTQAIKTWGSSIYQKTTPSYHFHIRRAGKGRKRIYNKNEFDLFAFVLLDANKIAYLPIGSINGVGSVTLRDRQLKYYNEGGKKGGSLYYQDWTLDKALTVMGYNNAKQQ